MIIEPLTKENFWDQLELLNPLEMAEFKKWINQYKTDHNWDIIFNGGLLIRDYSVTSGPNTYNSEAPKFHDLPFAFQVGIFQQFVMESADVNQSAIRNNSAQLIINYFKHSL